MKLLPFVLLGLLSGCSSSPEIILIGHLEPEPHSPEQLAIRTHLDSLNADEAQRPLGRRVVVQHAEYGKSLEELHAQAVRVATVNRPIALIGALHAEEAETIGDAAQADSILALTGAGRPGGKPNAFLFCLGISPVRQAKSLIAVAKEHGSRLLLMTGNDSPTVIASAIRAEAKRAGASLNEISVPGDAPSKTTAEAQIRQTDCLILCLSASDRTAVLSQPILAQLPEKAIVLLAGEEVDNLTLPAGKNCYTLASEPDASDPRPGLMRDAVTILVQLVKRSESTVTRKLREELIKKDARFDLPSGSVQFLPDGTCIRPLWLVVANGGTWKPVKKLE